MCAQGNGHINLPIADGYVGNQKARVLRNSGSTGVLVNTDFVSPRQNTGQYAALLMVDRSMVAAPVAKIDVDTPFFTGEVDALCLDSMVRDLIIGKLRGAKCPKEVAEGASELAEDVMAQNEPAVDT